MRKLAAAILEFGRIAEKATGRVVKISFVGDNHQAEYFLSEGTIELLATALRNNRLIEENKESYSRGLDAIIKYRDDRNKLLGKRFWHFQYIGKNPRIFFIRRLQEALLAMSYDPN